MTIKPLGERVVLKRVEAEEKTASGIVLPGKAKEQPLLADVVEVAKSDNMTVKVGDRVIFKQYSGTDIELDNQKYTVIDLENILAIVE